MRPTLMLAAGNLTALAAAGCADPIPSSPLTGAELARSSSVTTIMDEASPWARVVEGETGPGSLYAIYVPKNPNGDVIFYAHGIRDVWTEVDLRDQDGLFEIRNQLGAKGFTVAYSSYSINGFAVKDGAQRTHQLRGLVASELGGQPGRSFIVGHSLGGGIGLYLAEKYPEQYDGAVLMCGMVGGSLIQTQWLANVRAMVDYFYRGAFPGSVLTPPGREITPNEVRAFFNPAGPEFSKRLTKLLAIASTKEARLPFLPGANAVPMMIGSLAGALNFHSRGIENVLDITNGHVPFDNMADYTIGTPLLPLGVLQPMLDSANNRATGVERFAFDPAALNYLDRHFTPTGNLRIPVLTVHNMWDPGVPAFHQTALLEAVIKAGATQNLYQRYVLPGDGHCKITPTQAVTAVDDLLAWINSGNKPTN